MMILRNPQASACSTFERKSAMKRILTLALLILTPALLGLKPAPAVRAEILWDTWGVPHIFARDSENLFYAFGRAQMHSHGDLVLRLYGQARGRAAEYWGQSYTASDRWVRTVGIPERAREWLKAQSPAFGRCLDSFAAGLNDYAREHPDRISDDVEIVLPVDAVDVLAHAERVIHYTFVTNQGATMEANRALSERGSNTWAVAPARSASRHALLLANPHLPWNDLFLFYEAQLVAPGINAYGATLVGFPVMGIAFNDYLGWSHTVNTHDGYDLYELALVEGGYRWDGGVKAFETSEQTLKVKQADGSFKEEKLSLRRSVHGPVIAEKNNKAVALRVAGIDRPRMLEQWWDMARAKNLAEFQLALSRLQLPMFNVMYADRYGHIFYLFNATIPARGKGDWKYWRGVVSGDRSETLWTQIHPYADLPKLIDPKTGWLQNANDPPWTVTFPQSLDAGKFPAYFAPRSMGFRPQRSARMLDEDKTISFEEMIAYKHSTRMELADRILDDLLAAARQHGSETARRAADVLEKWDRSADAVSRGAALFTLWVEEIGLWGSNPEKVFVKQWDEKNPRMTPDGLADPQAAASALERAAKKTEAAYGSMDVAWGDVARLRAGNIDLPANGGSGSLGIFRVVEYSFDKDGRRRAVGGDSYVAAIEFSTPPRARVVLSYGNSSQAGSPHNGDQMELFSKKEMRAAWRERREIEAHLESREVFK
jgi:acyl-homoserine-lactone acylase